MPSQSNRPHLGHGVGLRVPHYEVALQGELDVDWVECITENFFGGGGRPRAVLQALRERMPLVFHGVSMGIGSPEGPSDDYLARVRRLLEEYDPPWCSDHLCWTHLGGAHSHDLLPLPYTEEALDHVARHVERVQDVLKKPFLLENVSSYVGFSVSTMPEWEFLSELSRRSGCRLLLDINNVVVNAKNHCFDARHFIDQMPRDAVWQLHLANHTDRERYKFDSHRGQVPSEVWDLYEYTVRTLGPVSSLIEWDEDIPPFEVLREQQRMAVAKERNQSSSVEHGDTTATQLGLALNQGGGKP